MKKVVHYRKESLYFPPGLGCVAILQTLDHPGPHVTNWPLGDGHVATSPVTKIEGDGVFETLNTRYIPSS